MALTPMDIHNKEFNVRFRGYDQDQVNDFLDQIIKDYEALLRHNEDLERALKDNQEKVAYFTDLKDALNQSIIVAQDAADKVKTNAQREAEIIQDDAEKQARQLLNESTDKSNQILQDASEKARQITIETDDLKKQTRIFRQRLQVMLESQLEIVRSPEWNELLNDDQIDNSDDQYNQQLNYSEDTTTTQDANNYASGQAETHQGQQQDYNFDQNQSTDGQYSNYDQSTGTADQANPTKTLTPDDMNVPNQDYTAGPDYQFDDYNQQAQQADDQTATGYNQPTQGTNTAAPQVNPGDSAHTQQQDGSPAAQLDPDYFDQNPEQNRPTIIFPDDRTSGKMNDNNQKDTNDTHN
ncbi:DivIVA domain-containing protein [Lactobacillus sp. CC-MHH1034]|uniref:DivIVA domain-containing protein n=1 Tax=Agrilactobacillus fermenti TaxID=2586909 RepID=UPI0038B3D76D|nr:DivIVA domain-containing protein [Agrilactobacillus fermenti]